MVYSSGFVIKDLTRSIFIWKGKDIDMTESLNYILRRIEYNYLRDNYNALMSKDAICLQDEMLPCNCITGIVVNYSAFLAITCLSEIKCKATVEVQNKGHYYYIQCKEGDDIVCPVTIPFDTRANYTVGERLCKKSLGSEAYVSFPSYAELQSIAKKSQEYERLHMRETDKRLYLEFSIRLLSAMRVQPLNVTSKAFLFMAIYLFPNRTLKLIWADRDKFERGLLTNLIKDYLNFLSRIENGEKIGFYRRLVQAFKLSTNIDISAFIEFLSPSSNNEKDVFLETLISALIRNIVEIDRERGPMKKLCLDFLDCEDVGIAYHEVCNMKQILNKGNG